MKKVAWILASGALIMACGGGPSRTDAGPMGNDTGAIVLMDSGPATMRDTGGGGGRDTGPAATTCGPWGGLTATSISPVPASCMPRCSAATLNTINMCPAMDDGTCLFGALEADTTATISMTFEGASGTDMLDLNCGLCFDLQRFHCFSQVCPDESSPFLVCNPMMDADMCMGEQTAIQTCLDGIAMGSAEETTLNDCFNSQVGACFDAGGGFLPSGRQLSASQLANVRRASATLVH